MLGLKHSKIKLKTFLFIEVTFNISCHTIMTFTKQQEQFLDPQPTSHLQKWTTDLPIRKHVPNFKTPPPHPPPTFHMDVINVWSHTGKDLKKESEWRDCRLQWLNLNIRSKRETMRWFCFCISINFIYFKILKVC